VPCAQNRSLIGAVGWARTWCTILTSSLRNPTPFVGKAWSRLMSAPQVPRSAG